VGVGPDHGEQASVCGGGDTDFIFTGAEGSGVHAHRPVTEVDGSKTKRTVEFIFTGFSPGKTKRRVWSLICVCV
jgi:hypothetical protein